jgi:hypothetical protein
MAELTYPFTLHVEPIDQEENLTEVNSYADLLGEIEGAAEVSRDEADALAEKILRGQEVNVSAMGTGLRLYGTKGGEQEDRLAPSPVGDDTASLPEEQAELLELLRRDETQNRLIHDDDDRRWYLYEFTEEPPRITDVRKDVAEALLEGGRVAHVEEEVRRVELPGGFSVYVLADANESTRRA